MKISESVLNELDSLDDLAKLMGYRKPEIFIHRLDFFKAHLKNTFPDFTIEEIVKFYNNFQNLKKIFCYLEHDDLMTAIEFEQLKIKENEN